MNDGDDIKPYLSDRKALEIAVAKARGWRAEPYIAVIPVPCSSDTREFDRRRLLDETGAVHSDWAMTEEYAWTRVPQWASISADRDELERHACNRFGDIRWEIVGHDSSGHAVLCVIGNRKDRMDEGGTGTGHSFDEKGVTLCRAYLEACENEEKKASCPADSADSVYTLVNVHKCVNAVADAPGNNGAANSKKGNKSGEKLKTNEN